MPGFPVKALEGQHTNRGAWVENLWVFQWAGGGENLTNWGLLGSFVSGHAGHAERQQPQVLFDHRGLWPEQQGVRWLAFDSRFGF